MHINEESPVGGQFQITLTSFALRKHILLADDLTGKAGDVVAYDSGWNRINCNNNLCPLMRRVPC